MFAAEAATSNNPAASVGAAGTYEKYLGWSMLIHAGASSFSHTDIARAAPIPSSVTV
jgi:hypothetical protein